MAAAPAPADNGVARREARTSSRPPKTHCRYPPKGKSISTHGSDGATPGPWWSTEKAFWTLSSRLQAKAEALGSIGYKTTDRLAASGLRRSRGHAQPADQRLPIYRGASSGNGLCGGCPDGIRCVLHLSLTFIMPHFWPASVLAGSCWSGPSHAITRVAYSLAGRDEPSSSASAVSLVFSEAFVSTSSA